MNDEPTEPQIDDPIEAHTEPAAKPPPPLDGNGKTDTISDSVRKARDMIPVGDRGVNPQTYAQWIDIAKDVCKATLMLPEHLHNNPPVMAGLLEISARFQLSAYMLASQTYVQNNRLCFQAQAFGAILYASGLLRGRLQFDFRGEGEDMTCTVSGRFRDDPNQLCVATTPPVKLLHPGYSQKEGGRKFVRGSPLWDKDPEQQLAYFGERRWIRRFAPDACMGMYTREEIEEIDQFRVDHGDAIPLTADRLGQLDTGEGWGECEHVSADLAAISPAEDWGIEEPEPSQPQPKPRPKPPSPARRKPARASKPAGRARTAPAPKTRPGKPGKPRGGRPPSRAVIQATVKRAETPPRRVAAAMPKWLDYVTKADNWIKALKDPEAGEAKWDKERDERDNLMVPMGERSRLRAMLDRKLAVLRPKPKQEDEA